MVFVVRWFEKNKKNHITNRFYGSHKLRGSRRTPRYDIKRKMTDIFINLHLIPFFLSFLFGFAFIAAAPLSYRTRTKTIVSGVINYQNYNEKEQKIFKTGIILMVVGLLGLFIMIENFGHNYTYTDIDGKETIHNSNEDTTY